MWLCVVWLYVLCVHMCVCVYICAWSVCLCVWSSMCCFSIYCVCRVERPEQSLPQRLLGTPQCLSWEGPLTLLGVCVHALCLQGVLQHTMKLTLTLCTCNCGLVAVPLLGCLHPAQECPHRQGQVSLHTTCPPPHPLQVHQWCIRRGL